MTNNYVVYKHTTPNNKIYIGITMLNVNRRWRNGDGYKDSVLFYRAINKYGWNNIKHEIFIAGISKEEADGKEVALIKQFKSNLPNYGYNIDNGGNSVGKLSESTKQKIRMANLGKKLSLKDKKKLSVAQKLRYQNETPEQKAERIKNFPRGIFNSMYGKHHSEKTKQILREKNGGENSIWFGRKHTKEEIEKISNAHKKQVIQFDFNNNIIKKYDSLMDASINTGISVPMISMVCAGQRKSNSFNWKLL